jgi:hypothetical protein
MRSMGSGAIVCPDSTVNDVRIWQICATIYHALTMLHVLITGQVIPVNASPVGKEGIVKIISMIVLKTHVKMMASVMIMWVDINVNVNRVLQEQIVKSILTIVTRICAKTIQRAVILLTTMNASAGPVSQAKIVKRILTNAWQLHVDMENVPILLTLIVVNAMMDTQERIATQTLMSATAIGRYVKTVALASTLMAHSNVIVKRATPVSKQHILIF